MVRSSTVDSGFYAACAGLRAKSQALEIVANNVANLSSTGYASAQVDKKKIGQLAVAIQAAFQQMGAFPDTPLPSSMSEMIKVDSSNQAREMSIVAYEDKIPAAPNKEDLSSLIPELRTALGPELLRNEVALRTEIDGLVISLREIGFYESGSAEIRAASLPAFGRIATLLSTHRCRIRIEGHTDNVPIHNQRFSDNWELSTARSSELVRLLITKYGFSPERLSAAGYAQYHPVSRNNSIESRAQNRRVDIVVLGRISSRIIADGPTGQSERSAGGQFPGSRRHPPAPGDASKLSAPDSVSAR
jgi:chemotaxis protein MotB